MTVAVPAPTVPSPPGGAIAWPVLPTPVFVLLLVGVAAPLGLPTDDVVSLLTSIRGGPPMEQGEDFECGGSYSAWDDGLTLRFARSRFVG